MKVLWLSHVAPYSPGWQGARQQHLARHLSKKFDLHWIDWRRGWRTSLGERSIMPEVGTVHTCYIPPTLNRIARRHYPPDWSLTLSQRWYRRAVNDVVLKEKPDAIVWSSSHHMTGYPPFDTGVPAVFDHIDACPPDVVSTFAENSKVIVLVSQNLRRSVAGATAPIHVIPNGVELERFVGMDRLEAKRQLGLAGTNVISLIGLTCAPSFYFLDAVASIQDKANLSLLIVGGGHHLESICVRAAELGIKRFVSTGAVQSAEVARYFAATDVGLYPGEDIEYYRHASPLKVVEYSAVGCQVVSSPVDMFSHGWPCVHIAQPTANDFAASILHSLKEPGLCPDLSELSWDELSARFAAAIEEATL